MFVSEEFLDDFDDDDDDLFSSGTGGDAAPAGQSGMVDSRIEGVNKSASQSAGGRSVFVWNGGTRL